MPYILVLLGLALLSALGIYVLESQESGSVVSIEQRGEVVEVINLQKVDSPYTQEIWGENGAYNLLSIEATGVSVIEANCPDQICVKRGVNDGSAGPIVCLPHQVIVRYTTQEYDEISG